VKFGHKKGEGKVKMANCISLKGTKLITKGGRGGRTRGSSAGDNYIAHLTCPEHLFKGYKTFFKHVGN
jgi:hypothetical protein